MSYIMFAQWFGIISTVLALGILFNLDDAKVMANNFAHQESGYIIGGVLPIVFGTLCFLHTSQFPQGWQMAVSGIGLFMLLIGAFRVLFVKAWKRIIIRHIDKVPALFSLFGLMLGLLLLYIGFVAPTITYDGP